VVSANLSGDPALHTILAVAIVPMVLLTLQRAIKERFELHKKIARWTWPVWMYVSITGVVIYLLLYQIFPQHDENRLPAEEASSTSSVPE
jgi:Mn2+/Fe2+ NRAMP family transporter